MEAKERVTADTLDSKKKTQGGDPEQILPRRGDGRRGDMTNSIAEGKDPKDPAGEEDLLPARVDSANVKDDAHMSPSASRSRLAQLRPKGTSKNRPRQDERQPNNSSGVNGSGSNTSDDDDDDSRDSDDASALGDLHHSLTTPARKTSVFKSMLARGGNSGSAAALALKERLGRMPKSNLQKKTGSGGALRFGLGMGLEIGKTGLRPPVQHSDSLSSGEGTEESEENNSVASANGKTSASSNEQEPASVLSDEGDSINGSSDEEQDLHGPRNRRRGENGDGNGGSGGGTATSPANSKTAPASQLKNRLRRLKPTARQGLRWPNNNTNISASNKQKRPDKRARRHEPPSPASSDSSSTTSEERDLAEVVSLPGSAAEAASAANGRLSLADNKLKHASKHGLRDLGRQRDKGRARPGSTGASAISDDSVASSYQSGVPLLRRQWMAPWRRLRGWRDLEEANEHGTAAILGTGRPAVGTVENVLYGWFGGVAGRSWPGGGLGFCPVFDDGDDSKMRAKVTPEKAALEGDAIRVHVVGTNSLPEDSRITRPMIVVHIVDSSTGRYLTKTVPPQEWTSATYRGASATKDPSNSSRTSGTRKTASRDDIGGNGYLAQSRDVGTATGEDGNAAQAEGFRQPGKDKYERPGALRKTATGGATTTFEERTTWDLTKAAGGLPTTGLPCETVPPAATLPWLMTMRSSAPVWNESLVFAESYRRLLAPETLVLFELVDFAGALSPKEARKGGGLSKIAWGFLRPIGADGECNVGIRHGGDSLSSTSNVVKSHAEEEGGNGSSDSSSIARGSTLQLFEHRPLSVLARWQARRRGFPRLSPPSFHEVPDVFLQFLLEKRKRYPATLDVSVGPTPRPRLVWVAKRPMASHERELHQLSYEALAAIHQKSREDRKNDDEAGVGVGLGAPAGSTARAERAWAARARRLRGKNEPCVLPDRLLHRVYSGQNGAITLAFSGSGALLAAACCDDPLPDRFPIRLIDSETGRCRHELGGHASMVYSLVWSPGDSLLLSASADGTAKVWRVSSGGDAEGAGESSAHLRRGLSGAGSLPATTRRGGKDEQPGLVCVLQHAPPCFVYAAVFQPAALDITRGTTAAPDGATSSEASECALVVTGAYDRRLRLWDVTVVASPGGPAKMLGTLSNKVVHESHVNAIVYDPKHGRLYSGDGVGAIVVWRRGSGGRGGVDDYNVLRKVQHADIIGKAITSLALASRLRRGQLLVQAHGNTLRLLDLGTYQLVNPGFAGGAAAGSLVRASFSPDGRFVVSGSEKGQVRVWEAQEGKRVRTPLQTLGTACCLRDVAWHPHQHVLALAGYGQDTPVLLYFGEARADKHTKGESQAMQSSSAMEEEAAREAQASAEEHRRRLDNRQRLRELRIKRLRAKALGLVDGSAATEGDHAPNGGVAAVLAALTAGGQKQAAGKRWLTGGEGGEKEKEEEAGGSDVRE